MIFNSVAIASDHRGYQMKSALIAYLDELGYRYTDFGASNETTSVDYPDFAGMSIAANRRKGIRAVLCYSEEIARLSREHNNANILCFGTGFLDVSLAKKCLITFMNTSFDPRHSRRLEKIDK